jgi:hypothetical protein
MNTLPLGPELLAEVTSEPANLTLDTVLSRNPSVEPPSDNDIVSLVRALRAERAAIEVKQEQKSARKQGVDDDTGAETANVVED